MMSLFFAMTAWAGVTDVPEMSTEGNIKWYTVKNVRKQKYATYAGDNATMTQQETISGASLFYFTASTTEGAVKIHNYSAGNKLCAAYNSWTADGIDWYLKAQSTGVSICTSTEEWNAWNDAGGGGQKVEYWSASDAGSAWEIELVTDFTVAIDIPAAKEAAIAELNNLATVSVIYPEATEAVTKINAVTAADNTIAGLNAAIEAINQIVADYKTAAYKALSDKYYTIQTLTTERSQGYMLMTTSKVVGTAAATTPANLWQFVENNGAVNIYNPYTGLYLCEPQGSSENVAVTEDKSAAGAYHLVVNADAENADAKIKFTSNSKSVHMAGGHTLVRWDNGGASEWQIVQVTDFSTIINAYKNATISSMDEWKNLSVVFDAGLITSAETAIGNINTTNFATFAAIDAEIKKVTDAVAAKMFTFQTVATDNHRENVWVSANASTGKAIGLHGESNYNSIWSLRHAGGVSFYMFNELNQVYMGTPSANCPLTETPSVAYTFEIIDAANGIVEMHVGGETLHASNHTDDKLLNWDGDEAASRWYVRTIDVATDIQTILDGLTEADYADVPALGQYTTAAYNALVEARTTAKTVTAVENAILAFRKAKNCPVFTIDGGSKDYAVGRSIYENNNGILHFKYTDNNDKTMLWMFDQTATTVGVTESVAVVNMATGHYFWGANALKITETSDAVEGEDDGLFLFYTVGNETPLHFQATDEVIVRYGSYEASSGSAVKFTYVGNSYDINNPSETYTLVTSEETDGWATLVLADNVVIPEDVKAYTIASVDGSIELEEVTGVLGANTPILVNAAPGEHTLAYTLDAATIEPRTDYLKGTLVDKVLTEKVYILSVVNGVVGFYVAKQTDGEFTAKANKAYMVLPAEASNVSFYGFRGEEGTTGVENVEIRNEKEEIFDLAGRRVNEITEKGIYIINGQKVVK